MAASSKKGGQAKHASGKGSGAKTKKTAPAAKQTKKGKTGGQQTRMTAAELKRMQERKEAHRRAHIQMRAVLLFLIAVFLVFLILIPGASVWNFLHRSILGFFGYCAILWPALLVYVAVLLSLEKNISSVSSKLWQISIFICLITAAVYIFKARDEAVPFWDTLVKLFNEGSEARGSGFFSGLIGIPLVAAFGLVGAKVTILLLLFGFAMLLTGTGLVQLFKAISKPATSVIRNVEDRYEQRAAMQQELPRGGYNIDIPLDEEDALPQHPVRAEDESRTARKQEGKKKLERLQRALMEQQTEGEPTAAVQIPEPQTVMEEELLPGEPVCQNEDMLKEPDQAEYKDGLSFEEVKRQPVQKQPDPETVPVQISLFPAEEEKEEDYHNYPPVSLLEPSLPTDAKLSLDEKNSTGELLVNTLKSFGVQTKIIDISQGPAVTRYELQPSAGVKISKITNLADDIALNLAASGVRIEAPIPNKAAVGIEVPNKKVSVVKMRELIDSNAFVLAKSKLTVALGRDIAGNVTLADLAKMPHTLIAGATGSGKSVCINSIIISLLYKATPSEVRFLMVDPKVVELGIYNGIPHLLVPVVTDPRKAAGALNWAVSEMLNRYKLFADANVRDLEAYNRSVAEWNEKVEKEKQSGQNPEGIKQNPLPQIVIIIDELADLMMAAPNEVEDSICRLAQMARAAGMHLVIATQRPSVDVITGIIKANIPSRIAFAVSSQVDSRTILDMGGAEKLLGRGDMLFSPVGSPKPTRIQGCFVSDKEIESVVTYVKNSAHADYDSAIAEEIERQAAAEKSSESGDEAEADDPMMNEAIKCVVEAGQASTSLLQRRLRLGYARAGRIIDQMEQKGIVGPHEGSKPRQVLITYQQYMEMTMNAPEPGTARQNGE